MHKPPIYISPPMGDSFEFWHAGSHRRRNHRRKIVCQSVQGFGNSDTLKFYYLHSIRRSILQQCKHCRATLWNREAKQSALTTQLLAVVVRSCDQYASLLEITRGNAAVEDLAHIGLYSVYHTLCLKKRQLCSTL